MASRKKSTTQATFPRYHKPPSTRIRSGVQRIRDGEDTLIDAQTWLGEGAGRDRSLGTDSRAEELLRLNRGVFSEFGIEAHVRRYEGHSVLAFRASNWVGALPLISPLSGQPDFGLVIEPRFQWNQLGDVLSVMGLRVVPQILPLPDLPLSERRIPPWVLSSIVLPRLDQLLRRLSRRFTMTHEDLLAPRGTVDWASYVRNRLPIGQALAVPCSFPDLREDEALRAAIHYALRQHRESLLSQRTAGTIVRQLLDLCEKLLTQVASTAPRPPSAKLLTAWKRQPMSMQAFVEGLQALEWTFEERGLGGMSAMAGLPWRLDMEAFFEAWVETLAQELARSAGAQLRVGRLEQTRVAISWRPSYSGTQKSLLPDVLITTEDVTLILDAKYKAHAEELQRAGWSRATDHLREHHRADLLQVLAYSTLFSTSRVVACLIYPCTPETFASLVERNRVVVRGHVPAGARNIELALAAVPMTSERKPALAALEQLLRKPLME